MTSYIPKHHYIDTAKALPKGDSTYIPHEGCTSSTKMWTYHSDSGWGAFCNKCGLKGFTGYGIRSLEEVFKATEAGEEDVLLKSVVLPPDMTQNPSEWHIDGLMWLYGADIRNADIETYGLGYSPKLHRVIIPIYNGRGELMMWQGRGLTEKQTKYYNVRGVSKKNATFASWIKCGLQEYSRPEITKIVVVEDALSVIRVGRHIPTIALLGTSITIENIMLLSQFPEVRFWLDNDKGGNDGAIKAMRKLSILTKCYRVRTDEDPKKLTNKDIMEALQIEHRQDITSGDKEPRGVR